MKSIYLVSFILLTGCVQAPIAPNLKLPEFKQTCPSLNMPPIPQQVKLVIDGDKVGPETNAGGKLLLKYYVNAKEILSP